MDIPATLLSNVQSGDVVLVLGAGASMGATSPNGATPPSASQLARMLSDKFLGGEHIDDPLQVVAELAVSESSLYKVQEYIRDEFQQFQPAQFHKTLPTFKWAALATTNFDLVIERAYGACQQRTQELVPMVQNGDQIDEKLKSSENLRLLKLHGCITRTSDPSIPLILTVDQYVTHKSGRDRLFGQLKDLSYEHILVFVGHSLQDPDIRQLLLELGETERRPRYFTVTPHLSGPQKRLFEGKKITPLEGTFEEFLQALNKEIPSVFRGVVPSPSSVDLPISERFIVHDSGLSLTCLGFLENDVDYIRNGMVTESIDPKLFYRGYNPRWSGIGQDLDVKRHMQDTVISDTILGQERENRCRFYMVKGHAGSGKSVLLQRIAWEAALNFNVLCLFLKPSGTLSIESLRELSEVIDERIFLFIDDVGDSVPQVLDLIRAAKQSPLALTVIGAERINEWNMSCEDLDPYVDSEYEIGYLSSREISGLLDLLSQHRALFRLEGATRAEQEEAFVERAGRQLLVALHEATLGKPFEDIIADEYAEVSPELARLIYLGVCFLNRYDVPVRAGIINRVYSVGFIEFQERFFQPLASLVFAKFDRRIRDYIYLTRHPHVADLVVDRALLTVEERLNLHLNMINSMNIDYESDRKAFRKLIRARTLLDEFPDHQMVEAIYTAAQQTARDYPYLFHQMGIYEMIRPNGNLTRATKHLASAQSLARYDRTIIHSFAELELRKAEIAKSDLEYQFCVRAAEGLARKLTGSNAVDSHGYHTLAKVHLDKIRRLIGTGEQYWNDLEFSEAIREIERLLQEGLQKFPGDSYLLDAESQLGEILADERRATLALQTAFIRNPHSHFVAVRLAKLLLRNGDADKATEVYRSAIEAGVVNKQIHFNYAKLLIDRNTDAANDIEFHLRRAFTEGDSNTEAQFWFARQLYINEKVVEARDRFRQLRELPINPAIKREIRGIVIGPIGPQEFAGRVDRLEYNHAFIVRDGTADMIFFHIRNDDGDTFGHLRTNTRVRFGIGFNFWGATATNVLLE